MREEGRRRGSCFGCMKEVRRHGPVRLGREVSSASWGRARWRREAREEEGAPDGWALSSSEREGWGNEGEGTDGPNPVDG
jgi:hypothetical protein